MSFTEVTIPGHSFEVGGRTVRLFQHKFKASTTLPVALEWILSNSQEATPPGISIPFLYQEVSLFWHLNTRRFIAYTLKLETMTAFDPRISTKRLIFVAHTHPTPSDLPSGKTVQWHTTRPSPKDTSGMMPNQQYSIVVHRDTKTNKIPHAFIYSRKGNVTQKFVRNFQRVAQTYIQLETKASTLARKVGQYKR